MEEKLEFLKTQKGKGTTLVSLLIASNSKF